MLIHTKYLLSHAFSEALEVLPYNRFLDDYGKEDAFKIDNYIHEEQIKVMYHDSTRLYRGYEECGYYMLPPQTPLETSAKRLI